MTGEQIWLVVGGGAAIAFPLWALRWFDVRELAVIRGDPATQEPCWTEEIGGDGGYSYSRAQWGNDELMDVEARERRGEFDTG